MHVSLCGFLVLCPIRAMTVCDRDCCRILLGLSVAGGGIGKGREKGEETVKKDFPPPTFTRIIGSVTGY